MAHVAKLTLNDGTLVWINPLTVTSIRGITLGGRRACQVRFDYENELIVSESPEAVAAAVNDGLRDGR